MQVLAAFVNFLSDLWAHYSSDILTALMWGVVGLVIMWPFFVLDFIFQARRVGAGYRINQGRHLMRPRLQRQALFYGISFGMLVGLAGYAFVLFR